MHQKKSAKVLGIKKSVSNFFPDFRNFREIDTLFLDTYKLKNAFSCLVTQSHEDLFYHLSNCPRQ
jgi:hypothetical protein